MRTKTLNSKFGIRPGKKGFVRLHRLIIKEQMELSWFMMSLILHPWKTSNSFGFLKLTIIVTDLLTLFYLEINQIVLLQLCPINCKQFSIRMDLPMQMQVPRTMIRFMIAQEILVLKQLGKRMIKNWKGLDQQQAQIVPKKLEIQSLNQVMSQKLCKQTIKNSTICSTVRNVVEAKYMIDDDKILNTNNLFIIIEFKIKFMSSPSLRKHSASPIRGLDDKSPKRNPKLHTILEQDPYLTRPFVRTQLLQRQNNTLNVQNKVLNDKVRNYAQETTRFYVQNSRLRHENQALKDWNYTSTAVQAQRMKRQILLKDAQIEKLRTDLGLLKAHYDRNMDHFRLQNQGLRNQLTALENKRYVEVQDIKNKYSAIAQEDMNLARKGYFDDISKLMSNLEATKALLNEKQLQVKHLAVHGQNLVRQHSAYLEQLVSENNILRNQILQTEIKKDNEVKHAEQKRELQKSRTHGIIAFCKQNTAFIQKQISNLAKELLEKSISIQQFTKDMVKIKRNLEQTEKRYEQRLDKKQRQCDERIHQIQTQIKKAEKLHKQELADQKKLEMELREIVASKQNQIDSLQREKKHDKEVISQKNNEIEVLKQNLTKLHDDHAKQISKVMTDSRLKRKSMRNLSQSSSLRDLSADGNSSIIKKPIQRQNSIGGEGQPGSSGQLYTVQQQLAASHLVNNEEDDHDIAMHDLVLHYENIIQDLKNDKALQLSLANENIKKLNQNLKQKQQQVLQILERFSPLMEYKLSSASIEEERKDKIEKHYKANIDILGVMLDKYSIVALKKK